MKFAHLHGHSTYSFLDGYGTPEQIAARMKELNHTRIVMTDHGNIYGHLPLQKVAKAEGLTPIFGVELYVVDDMTERTKFNPSLGADGFPHVTVLAHTQKGYENLITIVTRASSEGFYYKPRADWKLIEKYQEGLVVLSGCVGGYPSRLALDQTMSHGNAIERAWHFIAEKKERIESFYVELVPEPGMTDRMDKRPIADVIITLDAIASDLNVPTVMTADAHFPRQEDHKFEEIMLCAGLGVRLDDPKRYVRLPEYQYYCDAEELLNRALECATLTKTDSDNPLYMRMVAAVERSADIAELCQVEIPKAKPVAFWGRPKEKNPSEMLAEDVEAGIVARIEQGLLPATMETEYRERADREFKVIAGKGFADYLLTVADVAKWARGEGSFVMCRGSAGGCLLLWLLRASETDPIRHGLSFERFYDETRNDPPDVDMDFETTFRPKVIEYLYSKYGRDRCSQVASIALLRARNAVQDVAFVNGIPPAEYAALSAELDSKDDEIDKQIDGIGDPQALACLEKHPVLRMAAGIVRQARQQTINAAGFIISSEPLNKVVATITNGTTTQFASTDIHGVADVGLLKLDLLGVSAYDVVGRASRKVGVSFDYLCRLPVGDQRDMDAGLDPALWKPQYDLINGLKTAGVFQIDGSVVDMVPKVGLDRFEELFAASAICRPGAMEHVQEYANNKHNKAKFEAYLKTVHPIAAEIIRPTYGVLIYQEQVMAICRLMGRMPWPMVHKLRKRIASASFKGTALGSEWSTPFFEGCAETGVSKVEAEFWWDSIRIHGIYSFNASHACTYGIVGYWMLWLKAHYPEAYYEAFLNVEGAASQPNPILMKRLVSEYVDSGGTVEVLDPVGSIESFSSPKPGLIAGGWGNLKGVGDRTAATIVAKGPFTGWEDPSLREACGDALWWRLHEAGLTGAREWDVQAVAPMASWFPVRSTGEKETKARVKYAFKRPSQLGRKQIDGDVLVGGYVTARLKRGRTGQFRGEQILWVLEDETGMCVVRVARKDHHTIGARLKALTIGDFIVCKGFWTGNQMFIREFVLISHRA